MALSITSWSSFYQEELTVKENAATTHFVYTTF